MARRIKTNRKQKEKREELKKIMEYEQTSKSIIYNILSVLLVFVLFYVLTTLVTNNKVALHEKQEENVPAAIQYNEILAGETFNMPLEEYYVLFYDFDSTQSSYYSTVAGGSSTKVYIVNLGNKFNEPYIGEVTNKDVQQASDLKVKEATLIKIENKRNVSYFEGKLVEIKANIK